MIKYFYPYKKPSLLVLSRESIPEGMTGQDISDLFDRAEPIPYVGEISPCVFDPPDEVIKRLNSQKAQ
jgi:hypothetical protein